MLELEGNDFGDLRGSWSPKGLTRRSIHVLERPKEEAVAAPALDPQQDASALFSVKARSQRTTKKVDHWFPRTEAPPSATGVRLPRSEDDARRLFGELPALIRHEKYEDALHIIEAIRPFAQSFHGLYNNEALALDGLCRPADAEAAFVAGLALAPDSLQVESGRVCVLTPSTAALQLWAAADLAGEVRRGPGAHAGCCHAWS